MSADPAAGFLASSFFFESAGFFAGCSLDLDLLLWLPAAWLAVLTVSSGPLFE